MGRRGRDGTDRAGLADPGREAVAPFLAVAASRPLRADTGAPCGGRSADCRAVECFHKAPSSTTNRGSRCPAVRHPTLHENTACLRLNVGDLLIGEGYRLLAAGDWAPDAKPRCCRSRQASGSSAGPGSRVAVARTPAPLSSIQVLDISAAKPPPRLKCPETGRPLRVRASGPGRGSSSRCRRWNAMPPSPPWCSVTAKALRIAYQIRDDLSDAGERGRRTTSPACPELLLGHRHGGRGDARPSSPLVARATAAASTRWFGLCGN